MTLSLKMIAACLSIVVFNTGGQEVLAQAVQVKAAEEGQGFLFAEDGICYLLTAAHVTDGARRAQVVTHSGNNGTATMMSPFWKGFDLDVGQVRRIDEAECTSNFDDLVRGAKKSLAGARLVLPLVGPGGVDNYDISVKRSDYLEFSGTPLRQGANGKKGMSGSFALSGATPVGMARATAIDGSIRFIQMAEIAMNLRRWLDRAASEASVTSAEPEVASDGNSYRVISSSQPALDAKHLIESMVERSGPYAYRPNEDAVIVLQNLSEGDKLMGRIAIHSAPTKGYTQPKKVRIDITPRNGGTSRFWRADVFPPDGIYDTGPVARRFASEITITLIGARGNDPVRVDRIILD